MLDLGVITQRTTTPKTRWRHTHYTPGTRWNHTTKCNFLHPFGSLAISTCAVVQEGTPVAFQGVDSTIHLKEETCDPIIAAFQSKAKCCVRTSAPRSVIHRRFPILEAGLAASSKGPRGSALSSHTPFYLREIPFARVPSSRSLFKSVTRRRSASLSLLAS